MTHSAAGLDTAALETPLTLLGSALGERSVRFRRGDVPLPVGAALDADEFCCCSCGYRPRSASPAACPICAVCAREAARA